MCAYVRARACVSFHTYLYFNFLCFPFWFFHLILCIFVVFLFENVGGRVCRSDVFLDESARKSSADTRTLLVYSRALCFGLLAFFFFCFLSFLCGTFVCCAFARCLFVCLLSVGNDSLRFQFFRLYCVYVLLNTRWFFYFLLLMRCCFDFCISGFWLSFFLSRCKIMASKSQTKIKPISKNSLKHDKHSVLKSCMRRIVWIAIRRNSRKSWCHVFRFWFVCFMCVLLLHVCLQLSVFACSLLFYVFTCLCFVWFSFLLLSELIFFVLSLLVFLSFFHLIFFTSRLFLFNFFFSNSIGRRRKTCARWAERRNDFEPRCRCGSSYCVLGWERGLFAFFFLLRLFFSSRFLKWNEMNWLNDSVMLPRCFHFCACLSHSFVHSFSFYYLSLSLCLFFSRVFSLNSKNAPNDSKVTWKRCKSKSNNSKD